MIAIIGGGASGVILAAHLLKVPGDRRIVLIEKGERIARGLAYSTTLLDHVLNVRAQNMSALPDDPGHFLRWLVAKGLAAPDTPFYFAPRATYGDYLNDLLDEAAAQSPGRLDILRDEAVAIEPLPSGDARIELASGGSIETGTAVLAIGHDLEPERSDRITFRLNGAGDTPLDPDAPVLILGTGLSMVDALLMLEARGHRGHVTAVSRRGLLPQRHELPSPIPFAENDLPFGQPPSRFLSWLRSQVRKRVEAGGNWRDVVDGLRPFNQRIWQSWTDEQRRPFLRHGKAWWDTHRHRMAPEIYDRVCHAIEAGRLTVRAAKVQDMAREGDATRVRIRPRGSDMVETLRVARVYDCTGIIRNVEKTTNPLLRQLVDAGIARADPLNLSLHVTQDCRLIGRDGQPSDSLFALGPLTRSRFFEIDAIPEIRVQCAALAARLMQ